MGSSWGDFRRQIIGNYDVIMAKMITQGKGHLLLAPFALSGNVYYDRGA